MFGIFDKLNLFHGGAAVGSHPKSSLLSSFPSTCPLDAPAPKDEGMEKEDVTDLPLFQEGMSLLVKLRGVLRVDEEESDRQDHVDEEAVTKAPFDKAQARPMSGPERGESRRETFDQLQTSMAPGVDSPCGPSVSENSPLRLLRHDTFRPRSAASLGITSPELKAVRLRKTRRRTRDQQRQDECLRAPEAGAALLQSKGPQSIQDEGKTDSPAHYPAGLRLQRNAAQSEIQDVNVEPSATHSVPSLTSPDPHKRARRSLRGSARRSTRGSLV